MKIPLKDGDRVYATGVFLVWEKKKWIVDGFEDDTYFDGKLVEDIENDPHVEVENEAI